MVELSSSQWSGRVVASGCLPFPASTFTVAELSRFCWSWHAYCATSRTVFADRQRQRRPSDPPRPHPRPELSVAPTLDKSSGCERKVWRPDLSRLTTTLAIWQVLANLLEPLEVQISRMNAGFQHLQLVYFGLEFREHLNPHSDPDCDILAWNVESEERTKMINAASEHNMVWEVKRKNGDQEPREEQSAANYANLLAAIINDLVPDTTARYTPYCVHRFTRLLTVSREFLARVLRKNGAPMLPFVLRGTTDVVIFCGPPAVDTTRTGGLAEASYKTPPPDKIGDARFVVQVKKPGANQEHQERFACQLTAELFATDVKSSGQVFGLLTDFDNYWTFQWITREDECTQVLHRASFTNKREAMTAFASLLHLTPEDMERFKCVKVVDLNVAVSGPKDQRRFRPSTVAWREKTRRRK